MSNGYSIYSSKYVKNVSRIEHFSNKHLVKSYIQKNNILLKTGFASQFLFPAILKKYLRTY